MEVGSDGWTVGRSEGLEVSNQLSGPPKARLHPIRVGGKAGYVYSDICEGKLLVDRSRDPEHDAARALLAKGITGKLCLCDGKTGVPRTIIDIKGAAELTVKEGPLRFVAYEGMPDRASSPESVSVDTEAA